MNDMHAVGALLKSVLGSMGLERVELTLTLIEQWDDIAGPPWAGASKPLVVKDGELLVEASSPATVRFLRYSVGDLMRRLDDRFGEGIVTAVVVRPPPSRITR